MAVTLTERFRADLGGKKWIMYECVLPSDTADITAGSLDLTYVEFSWMSRKEVTVSTAMSTTVGGPVLKTDYGTTITVSCMPLGEMEVQLCVIGW